MGRSRFNRHSPLAKCVNEENCNARRITGSSASFFKARQSQTSACGLEGETAHPTDRRDDSGQVIFKHVVGRMKTVGYMWTNQHKRRQDAPVSTNPLCYPPDRTFARAITTHQVAFE
jgi:hypothetical protein